ncbi:MAG: hypothetical protein RLZZ156_2489, partial [Deinococcota bacterium]
MTTHTRATQQIRRLLEILNLLGVQSRTASELLQRLSLASSQRNTLYRDLRLLESMNLIQHQETYYSSAKAN